VLPDWMVALLHLNEEKKLLQRVARLAAACHGKPPV
jgi:hypothetical protein